MEIVELCKKYRHEGVVAVDLAGDESLSSETNPDHRRAYEVSGGGSLRVRSPGRYQRLSSP